MNEITPREAEEDLSNALVEAITPVVGLCDTSLGNIFSSQAKLDERLKELEGILNTYKAQSREIPSFAEHTNKVLLLC